SSWFLFSVFVFFFFSSRRRHTRSLRDWSSDVCSSDLKSSVRSTRRSKLSTTYRDSKNYRRRRKRRWWSSSLAIRCSCCPTKWVRSEERRVGKECRSRRGPYAEKKKILEQIEGQRVSR